MRSVALTWCDILSSAMPWNMGLNRFDGIIYINLARREDRKRELLSELSRLKVHTEKIHRLDATDDPLNGTRGCAKSHQRALEYAISQNWNNVLILEDDFICTSPSEKPINHFLDTMSDNWDVFFLGGNIQAISDTPFPGVTRVHNAFCAHAYAVNAPYMNRLKELYENCYNDMAHDTFFFSSYMKAIDRKWDKLMNKDRWYFVEIFSQQRASYSDIEKCFWERQHSQEIILE